MGLTQGPRRWMTSFPLSALLLAWAGLLVMGCVSSDARSPQELPAVFEDQELREGFERVLVFTPFTDSAHALWSSMRDEIADELDVQTREVDAGLSPAKMHEQVLRQSPECVVLVGNQAARTFEQLQETAAELPPAVVLMSSFAGKIVPRLRRATGIAYEVPAVTSLVTLRQLSERRVDTVGVLYRPGLEDFIQEQAELAALEEVQLVGLAVDGSATPRKIRLHLRELLRRRSVDALWVLNDNVLLTPRSIREAWLPEADAAKVPVLVGVRSLVNAQLNFGSVAVVPDHGALGVQAANLIFDLADESWQVGESAVELPLSVQTVVDMGQATRLRLAESGRKLIDVAVY